MNLKIKEETILINLLADFILNQIPQEENTIIKVVDCENFYVVKGKTSSTSILDLNKVKDEFFKKYPNLENKEKLLNTIDLIDYGVKLKVVEKYENFFYSTKNCHVPIGLTNNEENSLVSISSFPFGFSLSMGRLLYYWCKHIVYNIPTNFFFEKIKIKMPLSNHETDLIIEDEVGEPLEQLKSLFLDCYDFNLEKFRESVKNVNWDDELLNNQDDLEKLKEKIPGIILI